MTLSEYLKALSGRRVTVLGIGVSNRPLIRLLLAHGIDVTARDRSPREKLSGATDLEALGCKLVLGDNCYLDGIDADVIFRSPGIRPDLPQILEAVKNGAELTSEMEAFFEVCPCQIFAVTGSDGKTTTTTVLSEILKADGRTVHVGGNIGTPLLDKAGEMKAEDVCVLELSSFQLMTMKKSPNRAVITNVAPNHLDVHKDMAEYVRAKKNIFINVPQPQVVALNADNEITRSFSREAGNGIRYFSRKDVVENGAYVENGVLYTSLNGKAEAVLPAEKIFLPGQHNVENYLAAFAVACDLVEQTSMVQTAENFHGVPHRIEFVREIRGVRYYNDSIASSPSRTTAGLRSFTDKVILIAGGKDKGVPFDDLGKEICGHVKKLVLTGLAREKIKKAVLDAGGDMPIIEKEDFRDAVLAAAGEAQSGDVVLLSPACTSFDCFKNFEERGNTFKEIINNLE